MEHTITVYAVNKVTGFGWLDLIGLFFNMPAWAKTGYKVYETLIDIRFVGMVQYA